MDNKGGPESERWKKKYYESLGHMETKQKEAQGREKLLRQLASRLTTIADAQDDLLRGQLDRLRAVLREDADPDAVAAIADEVSRAIFKADRARRRRKPVLPKDVLLMLVDAIDFPADYTHAAQELRRRLVDRRDTDGFEELRRAFVTLVSEAMTPPEPDKAPGEQAARRAGLLERLFGRGRDAGAARADGTAEAVDALEADDPLNLARSALERILDRVIEADRGQPLRERLAHSGAAEELLAVADELAYLLAQHEAGGGEGDDAGAVRQQIQDVLLRLLERLDIPAELSDKATAIRKRLIGKEPVDLDTTLAEIAELIGKMRSRVQGEKDDIARFLHHLTTRLKEIDARFQASAESQRESFADGKQLDADVKAQMEGIEESVRSASVLDDLKLAVQSRVDAIRSRMDHYREQETRRMEAAEQRVEELSERLAAMEQETSTLRERIRSERQRALVDPLTGIANRLAYNDRLRQELARWKRYRTPLSMLIWDIDHFKRINDSFGHQAGDKVLRVVARLLRSRMRETDMVARYGGEEFVTLLPETDLAAAAGMADNLRAAIAKAEFHHRDSRVPITISCGIAEFHEGDDADSVFARADAALYRAKSNGRNQCQSEELPAS